MSDDYQRPEGVALAAAAKRLGLSAREAASRTGISDARWRQIVNGYQSVGAGQVAIVVGPADTLARMARTVGMSSDDLRRVGRADAADVLSALALDDDSHAPPALDRLAGLRDELSAILNELRGTESLGPRIKHGPASERSDS